MNKIFAGVLLNLATGNSLQPDYTHERVVASQKVQTGEPPAILSDLATQPNVARIIRAFPRSSWKMLFPNANRDDGPDGIPYNYNNLLSAAWKFPMFCGEQGQSDAECLHELVVMFAHFVQETGGKRGDTNGLYDGLYWQREIGCYDPSNPHGANPSLPKCSGYCNEAGIWGVYACGDRGYYGRGAKQLSWNYNYAAFSKLMTGTVDTYLLEPDRIITDGWPALASAIWFWMTPQMPKPSMHEVVTGLWAPNMGDTAAGITAGFGATTNIVNGAQECGRATETQQSAFRIQYYRALCDQLEVACFAANDSCAAPMQSQFPQTGTAAGAPPMYLDRSWSGTEECKPVSYQMPFLVGLDELACQCHFWPTSSACDDGTQEATEDISEGDTANPEVHSPGESADEQDTDTVSVSTVAVGDQVHAAGAGCVGGAAEWESCLDNHCCAEGLQCFERSRWWAACRRTCDPASDWTCRVLTEYGDDDDQQVNEVESVEPIDCVGNFGEFGKCSVSCGGGSQSRVFSIVQAAANGGANCVTDDGSVDVRSCNVAPCQESTTPRLRGNTLTTDTPSEDGEDSESSCTNGAAEWSGCMEHHCCAEGLQCYEQHQWWAQCLRECDPATQEAITGVSWSCSVLTP